MGRTEHHTTISELGFAFFDSDLPVINQYQGEWTFSGEGPPPNNYWVVTMDGNGHPYTGHNSPHQLLDQAKSEGLQCAYAAPYGRFVEGAEDGVQLHDWLREHRSKLH